MFCLYSVYPVEYDRKSLQTISIHIILSLWNKAKHQVITTIPSPHYSYITGKNPRGHGVDSKLGYTQTQLLLLLLFNWSEVPAEWKCFAYIADRPNAAGVTQPSPFDALFVLSKNWSQSVLRLKFGLVIPIIWGSLQPLLLTSAGIPSLLPWR